MELLNRKETMVPLARLDVQDALKRLGGRRRLYAEALKNFKRDYVKTHHIIRQRLAAGDMDTAKRMAHTVKGLAGLIGAAGLIQAAAGLEKAIADKDSGIDELLNGFERELKMTLEAAAGFLR